MSTHIWLRAEDKPFEERTALTPEVAQRLLEKGFTISVEKSSQSAIKPEAFAAVGCELVEAGSWSDAPREAIILGLKELDVSETPLQHRHIHFAHVFKNQAGWQKVLQRFIEGEGALYDLEYLTDEQGRRVAAFGYWAGFAGAGVGLMAWAGQQLGNTPVLPALSAKNNKQALLDDLAAQLAAAKAAGGRTPRVLVMGARGRSGRGAVELAEAAGAEVTSWDIEETRAGGPFAEILQFDVLVNCVFVQAAIPPFLTSDMLADPARRLSVISDVSCDPYGDYNPLPIYKQCTTFDNPTLRLIEGENPLDLISIDHLPSLLPVEASEDFCAQLSPYYLQLDDLSQGVWQRALAVFEEKTRNLR
ncbi:MAG: saccharopine dehydrogenase [Gammaproteobacteria bacterium]|nr:saccharopine dehydrogenase [Gammaproteobacteria bacterium]